MWIKAIVDKHGAWLSANRAKADIELRVVARAVAKMRDEVRRLADENVYMVDYLLGQAQEKSEKKDVKVLDSGKDVDVKLMAVDGDEESDAGSDEWIGLD